MIVPLTKVKESSYGAGLTEIHQRLIVTAVCSCMWLRLQSCTPDRIIVLFYHTVVVSGRKVSVTLLLLTVVPV